MEVAALELARDGVNAVASSQNRTASRKQAVKGQGFEGSAALRKALEEYSMAAAKQYFAAEHYGLEDVHKKRSYDLIAMIEGQRTQIEVKGTRGDGTEVLLTAGEVREAESNAPNSLLFIVHNITVAGEDDDHPICSGGSIYICPRWRPDRRDLEAYRFFYRVPQGAIRLDVPALNLA